MDEFIKVKGCELYIKKNNPELIKTENMHGSKYNIEPVIGTRIELDMLQPKQAVCTGDGICYYFLLTEKY